MKSSVFLSFAALIVTILMFSEALAQTGAAAVVTAKEIEYQRTINEPNDFSSLPLRIAYPQIKIAGKKAVADKIMAALDYEKIFDFSLIEERESGSLRHVYYRVNYNKNGFLDLTLAMDTLGAYPWTTEKYFVFDLNSGVPIKIRDLFAPGARGKLAAAIRTVMRREIKRKKLPPEIAFAFKGDLTLAHIGLEDFEGFSIDDRGLTFIFDYDFNFASLADEPEGRYFFSWAQLKPFIRADGLLKKFVS